MKRKYFPSVRIFTCHMFNGKEGKCYVNSPVKVNYLYFRSYSSYSKTTYILVMHSKLDHH